MSEEYLIERRLREESPDLHRNMTDSVAVFEMMLQKFLGRFPKFTDHSLIHSLEVLEYGNLLIGPEQVKRLSAEECYVFIMSCYLHDTGMGITDKDLEDYLAGSEGDAPDEADMTDFVRKSHNELSGFLIKKYALLFEIPSDVLTHAIVQVSRGHRKTDLFDEAAYPDLTLESGAVIRTAYLAAVLRLADEIDVASDRNPEILYDTRGLTGQKHIEAFGTHESIKRVLVLPDRLVLVTKPKAPEYRGLIAKLADKIRQTLDECRKVAEKRSDLRITQTDVIIEEKL